MTVNSECARCGENTSERAARDITTFGPGFRIQLVFCAPCYTIALAQVFSHDGQRAKNPFAIAPFVARRIRELLDPTVLEGICDVSPARPLTSDSP